MIWAKRYPKMEARSQIDHKLYNYISELKKEVPYIIIALSKFQNSFISFKQLLRRMRAAETPIHGGK